MVILVLLLLLSITLVLLVVADYVENGGQCFMLDNKKDLMLASVLMSIPIVNMALVLFTCYIKFMEK